MASGKLFGQNIAKAYNKEIKWNATSGDSIKVLLYTGTISSNAQDSWIYKSDITGITEITGTGYTAGGQLMAGFSTIYYGATTASIWSASTAYSIGSVIRPSTPNSHVYMCTTAGTSGSTAPTWNTTSGTNTDGSVTWKDMGSGFVKFDANDVVWTNSSMTANCAIILDDTGTATSSPLIGYVDFGGSLATSTGNFTIVWDACGIFTVSVY